MFSPKTAKGEWRYFVALLILVGGFSVWWIAIYINQQEKSLEAYAKQYLRPSLEATQAPVSEATPKTANEAEPPGQAPSAKPQPQKQGIQQVGVASWYDYDLDGYLYGFYSRNHATCASRVAKRYSTIRVTNIANGKSVDCYVNDFGPEAGQSPERIVDLSSFAFAQIADLGFGLIEVKIEYLK